MFMRDEQFLVEIAPGWMTAGQAEKYFGLTKGIIRKWIARDIRFQSWEIRKIGRDWWVLSAAIERIIKETERPFDTP